MRSGRRSENPRLRQRRHRTGTSAPHRTMVPQARPASRSTRCRRMVQAARADGLPRTSSTCGGERLATIVFWPHPLVHRLNRALSRTREEVCDNYALRAGDRHQYARALLSVSEGIKDRNPVPWAVGLMEPKWRLEDRIEGLLDGA